MEVLDAYEETVVLIVFLLVVVVVHRFGWSKRPEISTLAFLDDVVHKLLPCLVALFLYCAKSITAFVVAFIFVAALVDLFDTVEALAGRIYCLLHDAFDVNDR
jgi:hypothetical protein